MQIKYEQCTWGWNDQKKLEELSDERAWYLIAKCVDGTYLGFSHFRFDMDEGLELEPFVQRKGLGKFMMQVLELMGFKNNMKKVVLTILKNNQCSKFFKAMEHEKSYELDESSPIDDEDESYPYEILSKVNKRLVTSLPPNGKYQTNGHCCSGHNHCH
ncbi:hypothetical protein NQ318_017567 [Aromia moschata]|uniref:N-alpha-acetyltransferase 40 n=1 Tax=Aromia moschata TaxID=1265417 RepID=A0AAV8Z3E2_9CUCU|nr:hypothetical protein NQ318_017567 [Aromia moschata]